ncbi:MAG: hypothetical protein JNJ99_03815 [Crocinitomicaceae bacterium]|nr:hypothetical protein [Crocinitomicaceae bacterium]
MIFAASEKMLRIISRSFLFTFFIAAFSGCYVADQLLLEPPAPPKPDLQKSSEKAVMEYVRSKSGTRIYNSLGFSQAVVYVPQELIDLETLEQYREEGIISGASSDSMIDSKRKYAEENQIQRTVNITHFFTLFTPERDLEVMGADYILNDTFGVMNFTPVVLFTLPSAYETALHYFYYENTIFYSPDPYESRRLSNQFYYFYKQKLKSFTDLNERSKFYRHAVLVTDVVGKSGTFDQNQVAIEMIRSSLWVIKDSVDRREVEYSALYEKSMQSDLQGYYIFHKFIEIKDSVSDTLVYRFDFDPYFQLTGKRPAVLNETDLLNN